jgi:hypothetical protein
MLAEDDHDHCGLAVSPCGPIIDVVLGPSRLPQLSRCQRGPMTYRDGQARELAKWAHHRVVRARQQAEDAQRQALSGGASACSGVTDDWYASTG